MNETLRRAIESYTSGRYKFFCEFADGVASGNEETIEHACKYHVSFDENVQERIDEAYALIGALDSCAPGKFGKTYRVECWNSYNPSSNLSVGDCVTWNMKSASYDPDFIQKINDGKDEYITLQDGDGDALAMIAFEIEGNYKALDISDISKYDQHEVLVNGTFVVKSIEYMELQIPFDTLKRPVRKISLMAI